MICSHLLPVDRTLLESEDVGKPEAVGALPELLPRFFIPRLDDKPQNPIMDTLCILQKKPPRTFTSAPPLLSLPPEIVLHSESKDLLRVAQARQTHLQDIWQSAALRRCGLTVGSSCAHAFI